MTDDLRVLELRQYTLHPGRRDDLVALFDREFVETQEQHGLRVLGQFRDLDDPDRFVWWRGFPDMEQRRLGLEAFYFGPVWRTHRDAANATMVDSDDVLLLRPVCGMSALTEPSVASADRVLAITVHHLSAPAEQAALRVVLDQLLPALADAGWPVPAVLVTEPAANSFPALPVREGEHVLVTAAMFESASALADQDARLTSAAAADALRQLDGLSVAPAQELRLRPTPRSRL